MVYRMWCDACHKIQKLTVLDDHYSYHGEYTIRFELSCCNSKWTENYIDKKPQFQYTKGYDKNGC